MTGKILECSKHRLKKQKLTLSHFVKRLMKGVVTTPFLDLCCKTSDSYEFDTGGWYESLLSIDFKKGPVALYLTSQRRFNDVRVTKTWILRIFG